MAVIASQPGGIDWNLRVRAGGAQHEVSTAQAHCSARQTSHGRQMQTSGLITHHMASRQAGTGATCVLFRLSLGIFLSVFKPVQYSLVFFSTFSP